MPLPLAKEPAGRVVERELEMMFRYARRLACSDADAEDVVSQAILAAFKGWDSFDGRNAKGWLLRIVRNEWLQTVRRRKSRGEVDFESAGEPAEEGFWRQVDHQIEARDILTALESLPEEFRSAVTLCDAEQLTYEEAAEVMGVPIGTVRSRVFRGRRALRALLAQSVDMCRDKP